MVDPTRHVRLVYHIAHRVFDNLAPASRVQFDDLVSAGTEALLRGAARADDGPGLSSWLGRWIRGAMQSEIRKSIQDLEPAVDRRPEWHTPQPRLEDRILARIDAQRLAREMLATCSERERIILWATYGLDMTLEQMAPHVGLTASSISTLRAAALRRLRRRFAA